MTHPYELHGEWAMAENLCGMDDWEVEEQGGEDYLGYAENLAMENGNLRVDRDAGQFSIQARNVTKSRRLITESLLMMPFKGEVTLEDGSTDHPNWSRAFLHAGCRRLARITIAKPFIGMEELTYKTAGVEDNLDLGFLEQI